MENSHRRKSKASYAKYVEKIKIQDRKIGLDIIEKVSSARKWVSLIIVVPKPDGHVRICVDRLSSVNVTRYLQLMRYFTR